MLSLQVILVIVAVMMALMAISAVEAGPQRGVNSFGQLQRDGGRRRSGNRLGRRRSKDSSEEDDFGYGFATGYMMGRK